MVKAFQNNEDIHASTAARVFDVPLEEVTANKEAMPKQWTLGSFTGFRPLDCQQTNLSRSSPKNSSIPIMPVTPNWNSIADQVNFAREHGYVSTVLGRRRYLKDINSQMPVRGAESEMGQCSHSGKRCRYHQTSHDPNTPKNQTEIAIQNVTQIHDELVFDVLKARKEDFEKMVKTEMEMLWRSDCPYW